MISLVIDTSTDLCLLALVKEDALLAQAAFPHQNLLSKNLLPAIQELMEKSGIPLSLLSFIAAGVGPGSYTGTRLGAAVAKSLAFALHIKIKPFCSPLAFLPSQKGSFAFVIPTRSGAYFLLKGSQDPLRQESARVVSPEELQAEIYPVDYIVSSGAFKEKTHFHPSLNLSPLLPFLNTLTPLSPENIELQYLHTPY